MNKRKLTLPPDPEGLNADRAGWAGSALDDFIRVTRTDFEDALKDLLCNLMHWCDRNKMDFDTELDIARGMYEEETSEN